MTSLSQIVDNLKVNLGITPLVSPVPTQQGIMSAVTKQFYNVQEQKKSGGKKLNDIAPAVKEQFILDYSPYVTDPALNKKFYPNGMPQPNEEQLARIRAVSPNDATRSGLLKLGENAGYVDYPRDYTGNRNKTVDRGANMINSGTFNWLQNHPKYGKIMKDVGIKSWDDMRDPMKNEQMMNIIRQVQGYGAWYGPGNKGITL